MRPAALLLLCSAFAFAQEAREIVLRSLDRDNADLKAARNYTFVERSVVRELDGGGAVQKTRIETWDITVLEGSPYRRLIARDDKPLPPKEEKKQQERLRKSAEERRKETPAQRTQRQEKWELSRRKEREAFREIPNAFALRIVGEEAIEGRPAWVIDATPRPDYRGATRITKMFPKLRGRLWIDQQNSAWVKVEAETLDTISFGWFLARLHEGARLRFEQTRVNDEVWLPKRIDVQASGRIALVKGVRLEIENSYKDYRKFQTDSRVVAFDPAQ